MSKELLIIFTKNPKLGKVKTRLAKTVGDEKALEIYKFLLDHTQQITQNLNCEKAVYYSDKINTEDIWDNNIYQKHLQYGKDLGERMQNSFSESFENGYGKVVIIGGDIYDLESNIIEETFKKLDINDVIIGPAKDGGYYLIAMKTTRIDIFKNKDWGTSSVREDTMKDLTKVKVHLLRELNDIDVIEDVNENPVLIHLLK